MYPKEAYSTNGFVVIEGSRNRAETKLRASPRPRITYRRTTIFNIAKSRSYQESRRKTVWDGLKKILQEDLYFYLKIARHVNGNPQIFSPEEKGRLRAVGISNGNGELDEFTTMLLRDVTDPNRKVKGYY